MHLFKYYIKIFKPITIQHVKDFTVYMSRKNSILLLKTKIRKTTLKQYNIT